MVAKAEHSNAGEKAHASLEHVISQSLANMRQLAADAGTDDYWENWAKEVMDRRPLVFVAAVMNGQTLSWLMESQDGATHDGVLHVAAYHGALRELVTAECEPKTMPIEAIVHGVNWLVRDLTGQPLPD